MSLETKWLLEQFQSGMPNIQGFFDLHIDVLSQLFMAAVGMVFAPLAPLVPLAAMVVFWMSSFVYKYQLMFVYISKVETGGVCQILCCDKAILITHSAAPLERCHQSASV
jgi:hypothetical protein